jgi:hypothetical protein
MLTASPSIELTIAFPAGIAVSTVKPHAAPHANANAAHATTVNVLIFFFIFLSLQ